MSKVTNEMLMSTLTTIANEVKSLSTRVSALEESRKSKPTSTYKGKVKDTPFTKHDGTVVMTTKAQADAWAKHRDGYADRMAKKESTLKDWEAKKAEYKPSKAFLDAIKANRAAITHKIAKEQYGFVGTKDDLKALKDSTCK